MATIAEQSAELRMATFRLARRLRAQKADQGLSDAQFAVLGMDATDAAHTIGRQELLLVQQALENTRQHGVIDQS